MSENPFAVFYSNRQKGVPLFLSAMIALVLFRIFLVFDVHGALTKQGEYNLYAAGWSIFPLLGIGCGAALEKWRVCRFQSMAYFYPIFLSLNFWYLLILYSPWRPSDGWDLTVAFVLIQCLGAYACIRLKDFKSLGRLLLILSVSLTGLWALYFNLVFSSSGRFFNVTFPLPLGRGLALGLVCAAFFYAALGEIKKENHWWGKFPLKTALIFDILAPGVIFISVVDPSFSSNYQHYAFYLGPLADLQNGKSLLSNINAQYGLVVFYFLGLFFHWLPLGFRSFCLVYTALLWVQYMGFYLIVRRLMPAAAAFFALLLFLALDCFQTQFLVTDFPSIGPLRFGPIYVLALLVLWRNRHPRYAGVFQFLEGFAAGLFFWWSFEVCFYTLPGYIGFLIYEAFYQRRADKLPSLWGFSRRLLVLGIGISFWGGFLLLKGKTWPHWSYYFDYIFLYKDGFGMIPLPARGAWWIVVGVLYFSLFALLAVRFGRHQGQPDPPHLNVAVLLNFYGIFQFFYYLGRSHPLNLLNVSMPSLILFFYWLFFIQGLPLDQMPKVWKRLGLAVALLLCAVCWDRCWDYTQSKIVYKLKLIHSLPANFLAALQDRPRDDTFALRASALMDRYSPGEQRPVYLFGNRDLDLSLYAHRSKRYPFNDVIQAQICPATVERILSFDPGLKKGDAIYISQDLFQTYNFIDVDGVPLKVKCDLEPKLLRRLGALYRFQKIKEDQGISVYRVVGFKKGPMSAGAL